MAKKKKVLPVIKILVDNQKSRLLAPLEDIITLRNKFKIRSKGYFFSPAYRSGQWDGYIRYITEATGSFATGLLDQVIELLEASGYKWEITDKRVHFKPKWDITDLGDLTLRKDQLEAVRALLSHKVVGVRYMRGIMAEATNTGKSLIAGAIIASFAGKRTGILLVDSKDLYNQALSDFKKLFPGEVGQVNSKIFDMKRINVCMVQTFGLRLNKYPEYRNWLAKCDYVIVDEADKLIGRKDCKRILGFAYNAPVRIALTGTALTHKGTAKHKGDIHKGSTRNQELLSYFGPIVHRRTNKENVDEGISAKPHITFHKGNEKKIPGLTWQEEYDRRVVRNKVRNAKVWKIVGKKMAERKLPIVILFKLHKHAKMLMKNCPPELSAVYNIKVIHGKVKSRYSAIEDFNKGKVDVLIASMIIQRGLNLPRMEVLINAAGGDSEAAVLQIFGRSLRIKKGKKSVDLEEFWDQGKYISRHSKHRLKYYKDQQFEVKELY